MDKPTTIRERLQSGRGASLGAAAWNLVDVAVHVLAGRAEPLRIAGNISAIAAVLLVLVILRFRNGGRGAALILALGVGLTTGFNFAWIVVNSALPVPAAIFILGSVGLLIWAATRFSSAARESTGGRRSVGWIAGTAAVVLISLIGSFLAGFLTSAIRQLHDDRLVAADYWDDELRILSAGMGFDNIIGTPNSDFDTVRSAMGTWYGEPDCANADGALASTVDAGGLALVSRGFTDYDDGLPIVTSWPVLTSTVHPEDFLFTLNDGTQVVPNAMTMTPNWEHNERNTMVAFGDFGNRGIGDEPDKLFPIKLEIVDDGTPLTFVGPDGAQSGVGLTWETDTSPYEEGPKLVGAKLNHIGEEPEGEGGVALLEAQFLPNDEFTLFGGGDFKIRILTTGGFSPDGLTGVTPDQFADFFRLHAAGPSGETVLLTETGVDYELRGGTLRIVGMSDLGNAAGDDVVYDDCYAEDSDNYIDFVLVGDEGAARSLTHVEIPADTGGYLPFYNPGGPGPEPFPEVRYSAPGPPDLEPIINALDDPMRVTWPAEDG